MDAILLNEYRQLHLELSGHLDGRAETALTPLNHHNGLVPSLPQVPMHPVMQMVQDGWGHGEVPLMMRQVMSSAHIAVTTLSADQPAWAIGLKSFIEMIKVTVETLKPSKGNGFSITNNVMLDTLREVRI